MQRFATLLSLTVLGCSGADSAGVEPSDTSTAVDTAVASDTSTDSAVAPEANVSDGSAGDGGTLDTSAPDAMTVDTAKPDVAVDGGCGPASCGARVCGLSACGHSCGACTGAMVCTVAGACAATCPGTSCTDAWGGMVCYGALGYKTCPTDAKRVQQCMCQGGSWGSCKSDCTVSCGSCATVKCKTAYEACTKVPACSAFYACYTACADAACQKKCFDDHVSDTSDMMRGCMQTTCGSDCKL